MDYKYTGPRKGHSKPGEVAALTDKLNSMYQVAREAYKGKLKDRESFDDGLLWEGAKAVEFYLDVSHFFGLEYLPLTTILMAVLSVLVRRFGLVNDPISLQEAARWLLNVAERDLQRQSFNIVMIAVYNSDQLLFDTFISLLVQQVRKVESDASSKG